MPKKKTNLEPEYEFEGLHLLKTSSGEFRYYSFKNGNQLGRASESYKRREGVYNMLIAEAGIFNPGQRHVFFHDHTQKFYTIMRVEQGEKRGEYLKEDLGPVSSIWK